MAFEEAAVHISGKVDSLFIFDKGLAAFENKPTSVHVLPLWFPLSISVTGTCA